MKKTHNILLVDDEGNILLSLKRILRNEEYEVLTAQNALEGLGILRDNPINLVISDMKMPGMDGVEFLKTVRIKYPGIVRIILTGHGDVKAAVSAINEGEVYRFLLKPWNNDELKITIKQALEYHDLLKEIKGLLKGVDRQASFLRKLEKQYPGITKGPESPDDVFAISEDELSMSVEELMDKYFPEEKLNRNENIS